MKRRQEQEASRRLAAIVQSSSDAIIGVSPDFEITSWNRGAETVFGHSAEEAIGRPAVMLVPPEAANDIPMLRGRLARGERIDDYETTRMKQGGSRITVSLAVSPIVDDRGAVVGFSAIARDVTARKRAE